MGKIPSVFVGVELILLLSCMSSFYYVTSNANIPGSSSFWGSGEPRLGYACVAVNSNGDWRSLSCGHDKRAVVCEVPRK